MNALRWILALPFLVGAWACLLIAFILTGKYGHTFATWLVDSLIGILQYEEFLQGGTTTTNHRKEKTE